MPYIRGVNRLVLWAFVALAPATARADGIAIVGGSPRAIGRAGTATVGDDGGGALLMNPAAMARRDTLRAQLGLAAIEDDVQWQTHAEGAPLSRGQAGSRFAPLGAAIGAAGPWILGAGVMTAGLSERSLARPGDRVGALDDDFDYRYAGIAGLYRRDTVAIGAARRIGDSLALGVSVAAARVRVREHRRIWAGNGGHVGDPSNDVDLVLTGTDRFAESAVVGVLYAPEDTPIELGASVAWARTVQLDGTASAVGNPPVGPTVVELSPPHASLAVHQPLTFRAGGRYVGDRIVAEIGGDLWIARSNAVVEAWRLDGLRLVDASQVAVHLRGVPSRIAQCTHVALRGALDVELSPGFLWATAGYAMSTRGTPADRLSPSFGDLGGHTLGVGLETVTSGFTVMVGWSRTWSLAASPTTVLEVDNPFATFMGENSTVYTGTYDGSLDQVGVLLEVELGRPPR
jgi:hypothetical protein